MIGGQPKIESLDDGTKARRSLQLAKDWERVFESRLIEANKGSVQTGGNKENISAIHHAMSTGAGSTQSAGDYLSDVADYLEKNRSGNRETNMQVRKLADELKTVRGEIETEWRTEGATPNGYDPKKALTKIRGLFGRLRQVNL